MRTPARFRTLSTALLGALALNGAFLRAQQPTPPSSTPDPQAAKAAPSPAAFTPAAKPQTAKPSPAEDNPFPEEQSKAAQASATEQEHTDRKAADSGSAEGGSSTAAESGSSSRDKLAGMDVLGDHDSRIANGAGGTIVDPKLSSQDQKVGQQYLGMGNYQGAYERFKEACTVNPANVEAVFYLAEAARRTAHLDESAANYRLYLQVQPDGAKARMARKALAQLQGK